VGGNKSLEKKRGHDKVLGGCAIWHVLEQGSKLYVYERVGDNTRSLLTDSCIKKQLKKEQK